MLACGRRFAPAPVQVPVLGEVSRAHLDVTDEAEVASVFSAMPQVDIVVLSAGTGTFAPVVNSRDAARLVRKKRLDNAPFEISQIESATGHLRPPNQSPIESKPCPRVNPVYECRA